MALEASGNKTVAKLFSKSSPIGSCLNLTFWISDPPSVGIHRYSNFRKFAANAINLGARTNKNKIQVFPFRSLSRFYFEGKQAWKTNQSVFFDLACIIEFNEMFNRSSWDLSLNGMKPPGPSHYSPENSAPLEFLSRGRNKFRFE